MNSQYAIKFRKLPQIHWFQQGIDFPLTEQMQVIVRTQQGTEVGRVLKVVSGDHSIEVSSEAFVKEIIRPVSPSDVETLQEIENKEKEAFAKGKEIIQQHSLAMKLLKAEYLFDSSRLIFYYKAESKVDFRDLLKSLASSFRTRIELRQIGVRDETKLLGGIGCCGKTVCCAQFMTRFHPVSTKMAKDQNLSMNPAKLSGICCRLLCCIAHEHNYYATFHGKFPKLGAEILVGCEKARVMDLNYITQKSVITFLDRRKISVPLANIIGRKDRETGRNLWWVQEPGEPEPDLSILHSPQIVNKNKERPAKHSPTRTPKNLDEKEVQDDSAEGDHQDIDNKDPHEN